jgi:lysophospholipase II
VLDLVEKEIQSGIPSEKIFIGGFSQGGATALYTAMTSKHKFAGVIGLSCWLPLHTHFPERLVDIEKKSTMPIMQCHGDMDPMVPLGWGQLSAQAIKALGFTESKFQIYKGLSHSSTAEVCLKFFHF